MSTNSSGAVLGTSNLGTYPVYAKLEIIVTYTLPISSNTFSMVLPHSTFVLFNLVIQDNDCDTVDLFPKILPN